MKRKKLLIAVVMILSVVCGNLTRISAYADYDALKSKGNFVLDNGEMAIYASDVDYLQAELDTLYGELPSIIGTSGTGTIRRNGIQSKGILNYSNGTVVLDSSDFTFLADEIDELELEYKSNTVAALNDISTYFKFDGSITHNKGEETLPVQYAANLSVDSICGGILQSQSVDHLTAAPATADNISEGAAAWVNGQCIIGNGNDVKAAYDQGESDGYDRGYDAGYNQGESDGYDRGYDAGYNQGESDGYDRGYDAGYNKGESDGYDRGYDAGYDQGYEDGKKDLTITKKIISLMYSHSEHEETFALNDSTGYGYRTNASSTNDTRYGTTITLQSDMIPLFDLSDEENPKLLYKITYKSRGSRSVPNNDGSRAGVGGNVNLCDENGSIITSVSNLVPPNGSYNAELDGEFILTDYNTSTESVYLDITAQANAHGDGSSTSVSVEYYPTIECIYYALPEN